jgi:hypothetical protein
VAGGKGSGKKSEVRKKQNLFNANDAKDSQTPQMTNKKLVRPFCAPLLKGYSAVL